MWWSRSQVDLGYSTIADCSINCLSGGCKAGVVDDLFAAIPQRLWTPFWPVYIHTLKLKSSDSKVYVSRACARNELAL